MADSGREIILEAVVNRLRAIRRADGFDSDPKYVTRDNWKPLQEHDAAQLPALYVQDGTEDRVAEPAERSTNTFIVVIWGYAHDPQRVSGAVNRLLRDVKKSLHSTVALGATAWESGQGSVFGAFLRTIETDVHTAVPLGQFRAEYEVVYIEPLALA